MNSDIDILEVIELIQLRELAEAGLITDIGWLKRVAELQHKYSDDDIASVSLKTARSFSDMTGLLQKQKCTNKECGYSFYSTDISETCDICYHSTLRIIDDRS